MDDAQKKFQVALEAIEAARQAALSANGALFDVGVTFASAAKGTQGLLDACVALADVHDEMDAHFVRFRSEQHLPYEKQSKACREDWGAICARKMSAENAMLAACRLVRLGARATSGEGGA